MARDPSSKAALRVNVFPGGFNWGLYVAVDEGFFAREGLRVVVEGTPNSVTQMTDFAAGKFEIAMTAVDNVVAYVEGQGEAPIGPQPEFVAVMGSDSGFLSLVTGPTLADVAALRGRRLSVDAMTTGYAFVLYEILRRAGLQAGDYDLIRAGGMIQRWNNLREGKSDGTLLSAPYNLVAKAHGSTEVVKAVETLGAYQGNVAAVRRGWAAANEATLVGFIRAYRRAIEWLYDPDNRSAATELLRRNLPQMSGELAVDSYSELLHPEFGFYKTCDIDAAGLERVLELRTRYAVPRRVLADPAKYVDRRFYLASLSAGA